MAALRLVFLGSPDFAVPTLAALLDAGHSVACVYTQPPRPAGRGQRERPVPAQAFAADHGLDVRTPRSLRDPEAQAAFAALDADAAVVAAYGLILPRPILEAPRLGCFNVHASLLPRWRGAAPIQRAILAGDSETGVTIMAMEAGLDTGPMLLQRRCPITPTTTAGSLHDRLAAIGATAMVEALESLAAGTPEPVPQPVEGVTYAAKIDKTEARLDWRQPAEALERAVRAFDPWPGAWFAYAGDRIRVLAAEVVGVPSGALPAPGLVVDEHLTIACGSGALRPTRVQRSGRAPMDTEALLRGLAVPPGTRLTGPDTASDH